MEENREGSLLTQLIAETQRANAMHILSFTIGRAGFLCESRTFSQSSKTGKMIIPEVE
jgi:hypothetical protein